LSGIPTNLVGIPRVAYGRGSAMHARNPCRGSCALPRAFGGLSAGRLALELGGRRRAHTLARRWELASCTCVQYSHRAGGDSAQPRAVPPLHPPSVRMLRIYWKSRQRQGRPFGKDRAMQIGETSVDNCAK
jgi:hypothetical protein